MQFLIIAHDYKDGGLERRLAVRKQHLSIGDEMYAKGTFLFGVATLTDEDKMNGSVMVFEFPTRKELDEYLKIEPYVVNKVWEKIEIIPCKYTPSVIK